MLKIFTAAAMCLALASCQTTQLDTAIRQGLPQVCALADTGYAAFQPFAVSGRVKASTVAKVEAAYGQITVLCASKDTATAASVLIAVTTSYVVITAALKEARNVQ